MQGTINAYGHRDLHITLVVVARSPCTFALFCCICVHNNVSTFIVIFRAKREDNKCMCTSILRSSGIAAFVLNEQPELMLVWFPKIELAKKMIHVHLMQSGGELSVDFMLNMVIATKRGLTLMQR